MSKNSKNKSILIRLTEEEYEILQQKANNNSMPVASYVRDKLFIDIPILEKSSPEFKIIKTISYCAAVLSKISASQFASKEEQNPL
jgi:predicted DNA-binding protein